MCLVRAEVQLIWKQVVWEGDLPWPSFSSFFPLFWVCCSLIFLFLCKTKTWAPTLIKVPCLYRCLSEPGDAKSVALSAPVYFVGCHILSTLTSYIWNVTVDFGLISSLNYLCTLRLVQSATYFCLSITQTLNSLCLRASPMRFSLAIRKESGSYYSIQLLYTGLLFWTLLLGRANQWHCLM